jgi:hypothetical protein
MDFFNKGLQFLLLVFTPIILLEGRLIDKTIPGIGDHGAIGESYLEWPTCRACGAKMVLS